MSDLALRPRKSTELVDAAFQVYRREPVAFFLTATLIYVPFFVIMAATGVLTAIDSTLGTVGLVAAALLMVAMFVIGSGAVLLLARDVYLDRTISVTASLRAAAGRAGTLLLATIAVSLCIGVGFLLFLFPAVWVYSRTFAVRQSVLLEGVDVSAGFSRSATLSNGTKRHILNTMGLVALLGFVINLGLGLAATLIGNELVQLILSIIVGVVVFPLFGITETLLYYDTRIRKEGFDIEVLTGGDLGAPPSEASASLT